MKLWILFVALAAIAWGAYVPTIHHGQLAFGGKTNPNSPMRAFLFIGLAYFAMAVIVPGLWLWSHQNVAGDGGFNFSGARLSTIAGILGAVGALGVVFALKSGGSPLYVAPLVFAAAPIVNVLVAMTWDSWKNPINPLFFVGLLLAAAGAGMVLYFKPS